MRFKTWPVAALGLGSLLLLIVVSMLASSRQGAGDLRRARSAEHAPPRSRRQAAAAALRRQSVGHFRPRLSARRRAGARARSIASSSPSSGETNMATVAELRALRQVTTTTGFAACRRSSTTTGRPSIRCSTGRRRRRSAQRRVPPARGGAAARSRAGDRAGDRGAEQRESRRAARRSRAAPCRVPRRSASAAAGRACCSASPSRSSRSFRLRVLERRSEEQRAIAEDAERQMRQLSQQLVAAQEEERKNLSRELHDHVGAGADGAAHGARPHRADRRQRRRPHRPRRSPSAKKLVDSMFRTVRDLALGLRPSMLDDFGLQPALEWHVRDFTRRYGLDVDCSMDGDFDALPDQLPHLRLSRRAGSADQLRAPRQGDAASRSRSTRRADQLDVSVTDDGVGLDPTRRRDGLGLRGIEERVRELHGTMTIGNAAGRGHRARRSPCRCRCHEEVPLARAAG